jgi:hypothetical protein
MPRPHLIVIAGWQRVNIGDVAHVPGLLAAVERELPGVRVTLWPFKELAQDALPSLRRRFPGVDVLPPFEPDRSLDDARLLAALDSADFVLHGSGPATLGWRQCEAFAARTGRPFGVFGTTYGLYGIPERASLDRAAFVHFRDSRSLAAARKDGVAPREFGLTADCAFAFDQRDDARADTFLRLSGLEPGKFVCALARLRHTPFWEMPSHSPEVDPAKHRENQETAATLTTPVLDAVVDVVRRTPMKVLICPEDMTQIGITRRWVYDRLPEDVRPRVVWRDRFWMPDEAASVYARSAGLFGTEQHSPVISIGLGVPAIVGRWAAQSTKGYMWEDIGLGDWLFDFDAAADRAGFVDAAVALAADPAKAKDRAAAARDRVRSLQAHTLSLVRAAIGA